MPTRRTHAALSPNVETPRRPPTASPSSAPSRLAVLLLSLAMASPVLAQRQIDFLAVSDCQFNNHRGPGGMIQHPEQWDNPLQTMQAITRHLLREPSLKGVLLAGDLTQNGRGEEFRRYYEAILPVQAKFYDGLGNHDYTSSTATGTCQGAAPPYYDGTVTRRNCDVTPRLRDHWLRRTRSTPVHQLPGSPHYSWDWEDVHFVQLNLMPADGIHETYGPFDTYDALTFLRDDLTRHVGSSGRPIVLIHHYGFESFSRDWWSAAQRTAYWNALSAYNVLAIITGHNHSIAHNAEWSDRGGSSRSIQTVRVGAGREDMKYVEANIRGNQLALSTWTTLSLEPEQESSYTFEPRVWRVTNEDDDGFGSMRWAIQSANAQDAGGKIEVDAPFTRIDLTRPLPPITSPVNLDGSQGSCKDHKSLTLDGRLAGAGTNGLTFAPGSEGSVVRGVAIGGFGGAAIRIDADDVTVECSDIGVLEGGQTPMPNERGIHVTASRTVIGTPGNVDIVPTGGDEVEHPNVIGSNRQEGILIAGGNNHRVGANWIGVNFRSVESVYRPYPFGNGGDGIRIQFPASAPIVGNPGTDALSNNLVIAYNGGAGVSVHDASYARIYNALIGTLTWTDGLPMSAPESEGGNQSDGVSVVGTGVYTVIGGASRGNRIANNGGAGVNVQGVRSTTIQGNTIGLASDGLAASGNGGAGVFVHSNATLTIIGTDLDGTDDGAEGNAIAANHRLGDTIGVDNANVRVLGGGTTGTVIRGNRIGTTRFGDELPSGTGATSGVRGIFTTAPGVVIGGPEPEARNQILGHLHTGIEASGADASGLVVQGNQIGGFAMGNRGPGIQLWYGPTNVTIGTDGDASGTNEQEGNLISHNRTGISLVGTATEGVRIRRNRISFNGPISDRIGIDIGDDGPSAPDPGDADAGPNHGMNPPVHIHQATYTEAVDRLMVTYSADIAPENATYPLILDVYATELGGNQGDQWIGRFRYEEADAQQIRTGSFTPAVPLSEGGSLSLVMTATDRAGALGGSTSEFSAPFTHTRTGGTILRGTEGWRMLASPSTSQTLGNALAPLHLQGFPGSQSPDLAGNVYYYDESASGGHGVGYVMPGHASDRVQPGRGLFVYVYEDDDHSAPGTQGGFPKVLSGDGAVSPTPFAFALSHTDTGRPLDDGWNLMGNPFPYALFWDAPGWQKTGIQNVVYVWNAERGEYLTWNGSAGDLGPLVPPYRGFWVKAIDGAAELEAPASAQIASNDAPTGSLTGRSPSGATSKLADAAPPRLGLRLEGAVGGETRGNSAWLSFHDGASLSADPFDAYELAPLSADALSLFWRHPDGTGLDIAAIPSGTRRLRADLDVEVPESGTYTLTWPTADLPTGWRAVLVDRLTRRRVNLHRETSYTFAVDAAPLSAKALPSAGERLRPRVLGAASREPQNASKGSARSRFVLVVRLPSADPMNDLDALSESELLTLDLDGLGTASASPSQSDAPPEALCLLPPTPNPARDRLVIAYDTPRDGEVQLSIFDLLGREVATVVGKNQPAARHRVVFDSRGLLPGTYLVRLLTPEGTQVQRVTVVR